MPFTFAHPALFIPAQKNIKSKLSATGLILGSMIPDFEYFLKMRAGENISHQWYGILLFDIPLALVFTFIFHLLIRDVIIQISPKYLKERFNQFLNFNWLSYFMANKFSVFSSIIIGISSHLFLDAFTHQDGFFVNYFTTLSTSLYVLGYYIPYYLLLQTVSSIIGLGYGFKFIMQLKTCNINNQTEGTDLILIPIVIVTACLFLLKLVVWPNYVSFWDLFMALMGSITYSLILNSLAQKIFNYLLSNNYGRSNKLV
jgi:hypothetical protein